MTVRVLIADDQSIVRAGLSTILDGQPDIEEVGQGADGREAVDLARRLHPDVCLFDIRMPNLDGIEATRLLAGPHLDDPIAVLVITTFERTRTFTAPSRRGRGGSCSRAPPPTCWSRPYTPRCTGTRSLTPA